MIFNEVAFVIYYLHFPLITQQSLLHHYKHLTHQCVIAGEAKRLSTGTEKNPYRYEYPSTVSVISYSAYSRWVSNLFGIPSQGSWVNVSVKFALRKVSKGLQSFKVAKFYFEIVSPRFQNLKKICIVSTGLESLKYHLDLASVQVHRDHVVCPGRR